MDEEWEKVLGNFLISMICLFLLFFEFCELFGIGVCEVGVGFFVLSVLNLLFCFKKLLNCVEVDMKFVFV